MAKIIVKISPGKDMQIDVVGGQGQTCKELTKALEKMGVVESQQLKQEYFDVQVETTQTTNISSF